MTNAPPEQVPPAAGLPEVATAQEVAKFLRVSLSTLDRIFAAGQLPAFYIGRSRRFYAADVRHYVEQLRERGQTPGQEQ